MRHWLISLLLLAACHKPAVVDEGALQDDPDVTEADAAVAEDTAADVDATVDVAIDATTAVDVLTADAAQNPPPRVLFLGNSYTYVNELPTMTAQFAQAGGVALQQVSVTQGGATLAVLIAQTPAVAEIAKGGWTHVVLQGQSVEPAGDLASFLKAAKTLADDAHKVNAAVAFYQTWPRKAGDALYQEAWTGGTQAALAKKLHDGYEQAAKANGGTRVPVGDAWLLTLAQHPEINLYQADGSHPAVAGTYLAACVFTATLAHVEPTTVKWAPDGLDPTQAAALREMCRQAISAP